MQNNEETMEINKQVSNDPANEPRDEAVKDTGDNSKTAEAAPEPTTKPANEAKAAEDLAVEDPAAYYASTKPPGRKFPASMADEMLFGIFIDPDAPSPPPPAPEGSEDPPNKKCRPAKRRR